MPEWYITKSGQEPTIPGHMQEQRVDLLHAVFAKGRIGPGNVGVKIPTASGGAFVRKLSVMLGESVPQTP